MTDPALQNRIAYESSMEAARTTVRDCLLGADPAISDVTRHLSAQTGKGLRAALLLAASSGPDGQVPAQAVPAAAALEILHLATLVHDDVIDEAATRRGQPSVQGRFGRKVAVLGGDYLFCRCFSMVAALLGSYPDRLADFSAGMTRVCTGEIEQLRHNRDVDLGLRGYLRIISGKTAALFALASYAGGVLAGETERDARVLGRFGFLFGMLFQIMDDCLDYEDDESDARKTVRHDLAEGVVTPPLIYSIAKNPLLREAARTAFDNPAELRAVLAEVAVSGGVRSSWTLAGRYLDKARRQLERVGDPYRRERLQHYLDEAVGDRMSRRMGAGAAQIAQTAGAAAG